MVVLIRRLVIQPIWICRREGPRRVKATREGKCNCDRHRQACEKDVSRENAGRVLSRLVSEPVTLTLTLTWA